MNVRRLAMVLALMGCAGRVTGQQSGERARPLPSGYGSLSQNDLALRVGNDEIEIRFVPLDPRITPLLARDAYQSLRSLVETNRRAIDSVGARAGVAQPGLALVSFFGQRPDVRFDPQTVTLLIRNRAFRPLGVIPLNPKFSSQQLGVREQASALYLFEETIPVDDSFTLTYGSLVSEDWQKKQPTLDRERARVAAKSRTETPDTTR
ncbi:MAG TPA: hypothetical protein VE420_16770 [Gemmatimonadales bacterium]|jgi:hypothetical protein|nr:hypothetical protein [Gemmatimonadales bacterium]